LLVNSDRFLAASSQKKSKLKTERDILERQVEALEIERKRLKKIGNHAQRICVEQEEKVREKERELKSLINFLKNGNSD
jgi:DNA repair exonuclease SbcCD ATPase subunit